MRVSLKWLKTLTAVDLPVDEFVDLLDMTGTAVEGVHETGQSIAGVVVGQIIEKVSHPDAEKLWVTQVDVGDGTPRQIVCGAQNFNAGDKVPVALVGAVLPGDFAIKKAKLRGVVSEGMNCSARELGMGDDHAGLLILPADAPVGMAFSQYADRSDIVLDLEVTPNRPDCLSMAGVAREVAAVLGGVAETPAATPAETGTATADVCTVSIEDPALCSRYTARVIRGVKIGPSPDWLAERVAAAGARPINNIVDITNYVMFELGQPLHAFDLATLRPDAQGRAAITVRTARAGETLTTLDGAKRALTEDTLLICDPRGPIALAGVMGGEETEVTESTVDILLESACFDTACTSRTSRRLGLVSEASMRFERGVDASGCVAALDRAAALMAELGGGVVAPGVVDVYPAPAPARVLLLRRERLTALVGSEIPSADAAAILGRLGCTVTSVDDDFEVTVPTFRPDIEREIDLIEEVLRVWGMERIPAKLPAGTGRAGGLSREQVVERRIGQVLRATGLCQTMTYSFVDPADLARARYTLAEDEVLVELLNPMSGEQSVMRPTLLCGLLRSLGYNQRRGVDAVHLYESGSVFVSAANRKQPKERLRVAGVLAGSWNAPGWNEPAETLGFFDGKGVLEAFVGALKIERFKVRVADRDWLQPGRSAEVLIGGDVVGWLGEVHPEVLGNFECFAPVVAFELDGRALLRGAADIRGLVEPPRYPAVSLDVAVVVDETVTAERLEQAFRSAGGKLLEGVRLFDVYRGASIGDGRKSMAFALTYRAPDRTLTAEEVDTAHEKVVRKVLGATGGELRR